MEIISSWSCLSKLTEPGSDPMAPTAEREKKERTKIASQMGLLSLNMNSPPVDIDSSIDGVLDPPETRIQPQHN